MDVYEICAIILISGITAHLVSCYEMTKASKIMKNAMRDYAEKTEKIIRDKLS